MNCKHCGRSFSNAPARLLASHEYDCMANPANFDADALDHEEAERLADEQLSFPEEFGATPSCPGCGSHVATPLGTLGPIAWARCRNCGLNFDAARY